MISAQAPYKSTPVFDENTLPAGLRREHRTKVGVWGIIRVVEGRVRYRILDPVSETIPSSISSFKKRVVTGKLFPILPLSSAHDRLGVK